MTAIEQLVIDNIGAWTTAIKPKASTGKGSGTSVDLYGIEKLRELILDLAVRGLLVDQKPSDDSANILLAEVQGERKRLIESGELKKQKPTQPVDASDIPFDLPANWAWAKLADVSPTSIFDGDWVEKKDQDPEGNIRLIQLADIGVNVFKDSSRKWINEEAFDRLKCCELRPGDVLIARLPSPIGRACVFPELTQRAITAVDVAILRPNEYMVTQYLVHAINSRFFRSQVESFGKGVTRFRIATGNLKTILIPVPPRSEQLRIARRVDELMLLCDQLEAQQADSIEAHKRLVTTLLDALTKATEQEGFDSAWARIADHFDVLFTTEWSVNELENSVLQMAASGYLSPQNLAEEPAAELLKRVSKEKGSLSREQRIGKQSKLVSIDELEHKLRLPRGWALSGLGALGVSATGKTPKTSRDEFYGGSISFIGPGQIDAVGNILEPEKTLTEQGLQESVEASSGDILMVCIGGSIGKSALVKGQFGFNQQINLIRPMLIDAQFLYLMMRAPFFQESVIKHSTGSATPIINRSKWDNLLIPVAPLPEQRRIVKKVEELMAICGTLKSAIKGAQQTQLLLADSITEQAVA